MSMSGAVLAAFSLSAYTLKWSPWSCIYFQSSCIIGKSFTSGIKVWKTGPPPLHVQIKLLLFYQTFTICCSVSCQTHNYLGHLLSHSMFMLNSRNVTLNSALHILRAYSSTHCERCWPCSLDGKNLEIRCCVCISYTFIMHVFTTNTRIGIVQVSGGAPDYKKTWVWQWKKK